MVSCLVVVMEKAGKQRISGTHGVNDFIGLNGVKVCVGSFFFRIKQKTVGTLTKNNNFGVVFLRNIFYKIIGVFFKVIIA